MSLSLKCYSKSSILLLKWAEYMKCWVYRIALLVILLFSSFSFADRRETFLELVNSKKYLEAESLVKDPAQEGDSEAQFLYAFLLLARQDKSYADWLGKSIGNGNAEAMYFFYSMLIIEGKDITPESKQFLIKASELGNLDAKSLLGLSYIQGDGAFQQQITKGERLALEAANKGHA